MSDRTQMSDPPLVRPLPEEGQEIPAGLLERLDELENENRRLRRLGTATLVGAAVVLVAVGAMTLVSSRAISSGAVVRARSFVLEDAKGQARGTWSVTDGGGVQLAVMDPQGKPRARLSVLGDGSPGLALVDASGQPRAALGLLADGTISLVFADPQGQSRAVLGLTSRGAGSVAFADMHGVTRAGLGLDTDGKPALTLDEFGAPR